jgi:hypothetical protein
MKEDLHLTPEEIALAADLLNSNKEMELNERIRSHIKVCDQCASEVLITAQISFDTEIQSSVNKKRVKPTMLRQLYISGASAAAAAALIWGIFYLAQKNIPEFSPDTTAEKIERTIDSTSTPAFAEDIKTESKPEITSPDLAENTENESNETRLNEPSDKKNPTTEVEVQAENNLLLASFETHDDLEKLYNNYRGTFRSSSISIHSDSVVNLNDTNMLKWANPDGEELIAEIFNNSNELVKSYTTQKEEISISGLEPGLYYWKLINQDFDLLFVGKIISD